MGMLNERIASFIDSLIFYVSCIIFFLFPILFLPSTSEFTEYGKLLLLIFGGGLLLILWIIKSILRERFVIASVPLGIPLLFLSIALALSTWNSLSRYVSLFGVFNSWHWTLAGLLSSIALFYSVVTNLQRKDQVNSLGRLLFLSIVLVALLDVFSASGLFANLPSFLTSIPFFGDALRILSVRGFSPIGNFPSVLAVLVLGLFLGTHFVRQGLKDGVVWKSVALGLGTGLILVSLLLTIYPLWAGTEFTFSRLDLSSSWRIASSSIRDRPLWGTGPSQYRVAYNAYRPLRLNQTDYWNVIFNRSGSEFLTWLTTGGVIGFLAFTFLCLRVFSLGVSTFRRDGGDNWGASHARVLALWSILITVSFVVVSSSIAMIGTWFLVLSLWMLTEKIVRRESSLQEGNPLKVSDVVLSFSAIQGGGATDDIQEAGVSKGAELIPWIVAFPVVVLVGVLFFYSFQDLRSNLAYVRSLRGLGVDKPAREVYNSQREAINLNPFREAYRRAYSQTNIELARVIAQRKGESLTSSERDDVLTLVQQAIREARLLTEVINPASALNWRVRGNLYKNLLSIARGAEQWSLSAFNSAIQLSPTDPRIQVDLGNLYYALAVNEKVGEGKVGEEPGEDAPEVVQSKKTNLARAELSFRRALSLKPDYANAHYNLAAVYEEAELYQLAQQQLQETLQYLEEDTADYERTKADLARIENLLPIPKEDATD